MTTARASADDGARRDRGLRAVAMLEATKGVLALLAAGGLQLLGPAPLQRFVNDLTHALHLAPERGASAWLGRMLSPDALHLATALAVLYGLLRLIEASGLWRARAWASWFGAFGAAAYVPFEVIALLRHPHWLTAVVLAINVLVVWILARDLWRRSSRNPT